MIYGGALADHLSLPYLSFAFDNPFICGELFQRHRTAGVKFLCTDADFGTQPELRSVREGRWYVDIHTGGIHITAVTMHSLCLEPYFWICAMASRIDWTVLTDIL